MRIEIEHAVTASARDRFSRVLFRLAVSEMSGNEQTHSQAIAFKTFM